MARNGGPALGTEAEETLVARPDPLQARKYKREFYIMSVAMGLNHATVTTPILYAPSVLTKEIGQASNAVLYGATLICSLFFSNLIYAKVGAKKGLACSMFLYTVYVGLFALSSTLCATRDDKDQCVEAETMQLPVSSIGALIGGLGAGLLWTCQGAFYAMVCENLAIAEGTAKETVTARLAGTFGVIFLGFECAIRFVTTLLTGARYAHLSYMAAFLVWTVLAFASTAFFAVLANDLQPAKQALAGSVCDKLLTAVRLWREPKLWLLQTTNITFGFGVAWLNGFVGPNILSVALSSSFLGFAGALLSGLAAVLSKILAPVAAKIGKGPVLALGSLAFLALGVLSKWVGKPAQWGYGTIVFYVFMGVGRAVYESTNKAIIADFFPGGTSAGAFANVFVFGTASSCAAFILGSVNTTAPELYLLLIFAALTLPAFLSAWALRLRERRCDAGAQEVCWANN